MNKHIWKIWIPVTTLIILIVAYGLFRLWQYRTHSHRLDKAITSIIDTLSADPNYIVTERIVIKVTERNLSDPTYFLDYLNQSLQVCVRKGIRKGPPSWGIKLDKIVRKLPRFLRPSRNLYLYTTEDNWINITAVEPILPDELQLLKSQVTSIGLPRDIRIQFSSFFPDRKQNQQLLGRKVNGMWTVD
ncbi:MAG: hypothetical protein ACYS3N_02055 [Planctomycetota bacterium]|jgi:hypothetical protein